MARAYTTYRWQTARDLATIQTNGDTYPEERYRDLGGVRTRYYDRGDGPPIVLVHGGDFRSGATADDWSRNIAPLSRDHRVLALDKLGQGFTANPASEDRFTMTAVADHLAEFVETLALTRVTMVGHSRGALPAALVALDEPDRVAGLVVVATNTLAPDHPATPPDFYPTAYANRPADLDAEFVRREPEMNSHDRRHISSEFVTRRLAAARLDKSARAKAVMDRQYAEVFVLDMDRLKHETLERIASGELSVPVLVIWGADDPSAPVALARPLVKALSVRTTVRLEVVEGAGHYPYREHPRIFDDLIHDFIADYV